jgi:hypothetical protein
VFRKLAQLLDVDVVSTPPVDGDALTYDDGSGKWVPLAGGGGGADDQTAAEVPFTPAGTIAATDTQSAVEEVATDAAAAVSALSSVYQPLDSDLTSIAALTTTSFGRGLLALANQAALLSAAGAAAASHVHAGEDITSGTVADARIASTIARDSEVTSAISALSTVYQPLDSDLTSIAALTTTTFGRAFLALADEAAFKAAVNLEAGTDFPSQSTFDDHSARHEDGGADEISIAGLSGTSAALQSHLDDTSDAHDASAISVLDTNGDYTATTVEGVLAEIAPQLGGGSGQYSPDAAPSSPSAYDDEFAGTSLDGAWTSFGSPDTLDATFDGWLAVADNEDVECGIYKTFTPGANAFTVVAKVTYMFRANFAAAGLKVTDSSGTELGVCDYQRVDSSGTLSDSAKVIRASIRYGATGGSNLDLGADAYGTRYVMLRRDATTNYEALFSVDGISWVSVGAWSQAGTVGRLYLQMYAFGGGSTTVPVTFEFVRTFPSQTLVIGS